MPMGGAEKVLLGMLSTIDYSHTDVCLGLFRIEGEMLPFIPQKVQVKHIDIGIITKRFLRDSPIKPLKLLLRQWRLIDALVYCVIFFLCKRNPNKYILFYRYFLRNIPVDETVYDEAHSFYGTHEAQAFYLTEKIRAKSKICWIHTDVSKNGYHSLLGMLLPDFDRIFTVSRQAKEAFINHFPNLKPKTEVHCTAIPRESILSLSSSGPSFTDGFEGIRILTVARISKEKGEREALAALKVLKDAGACVRWYFVGDGPDMDACKSLAESYHIENAAVFLGMQLNPYGYMKNCDIYVQPSRYDSFCIALAEAVCLDKPIVATDFVGAREQLSGNEKSVIVDNTVDALVEGIQALMGRFPKQV